MLSSAIEWFKNQSLSRKQTLALVVCNLIPLIGVGGGSILLLVNGLRNQLTNQAKSELAVIEINYNTKIDQMGFGSRGQADNATIIAAAKGDTANLAQIQQILQNELQARKIEYATLVGLDKAVIINANNSRKGDKFDPNNLVSEVLAQGKQIKASVLIDRAEIGREGFPSTIDDRTDGRALVRFVVTPIKESNGGKVIGALVFGDLVNGKMPIVQRTNDAFINEAEGGYSGIYQRFKDKVSLTTSLEQKSSNIALPDNAIKRLEASAKDANGKPVTDRLTINNRTYTVAAKLISDRTIEAPGTALPDKKLTPEAPTLLVRGTPEDQLNAMLTQSLLQAGVIGLLSLGLIIGWNRLFRKTILQSIEELTLATQAFASGDRSARSQVSSQDEVGQLATQFNTLADTLAVSERKLSEDVYRKDQQAKDAQSLNQVVAKMRDTLDFDSIVQTAVTEVRSLFQCDRVVLYQFTDDGYKGIAVAESVASPYPELLHNTIEDLLQLSKTPNATTKAFWSLEDVSMAQLDDRHREHLENYGIQSNLMAPVRRDHQLIGLLAAHQCRSPRTWQINETTIFVQIANQIGYALDQAALVQKQQQSLQVTEMLKDGLQQQVLTFLKQVEGATSGDLTVRAEVLSGDIGTVADFFNSIIENLRGLVLQVQQSTRQVNTLLVDNDGALKLLSQDSSHQSKAVTALLTNVAEMTRSIEQVAAAANQAKTVTQESMDMVEFHESTMDAAVEKISLLRSTVDDTAQKVRQFGQSSVQISRIVSLITDFAVQTDVLAVNAGLEASRAGEQGRGFAMLAGEIASLAARSTQAAREISQIVESIQVETHALSHAIAEGTAQAADSSHQIRNTKQAMTQMSHVSRKVNGLVTTISESALTQADTARSIQELMGNIETVSIATATATDQVSTALHQTVETAQSLQRSVEIFKVQA
jgi:twitching motility protein PilJ